jgi:hypothetical protein
MNQNSSLRVLIAHVPPTAFVEGTEDKQLYSGFLVDLLAELLPAAGITADLNYTVVEVSNHIHLVTSLQEPVMKDHITQLPDCHLAQKEWSCI